MIFEWWKRQDQGSFCVTGIRGIPTKNRQNKYASKTIHFNQFKIIMVVVWLTKYVPEHF